MNTLDDFFENAKERNLCERGAKIWEHCKSKKSLIDFALGSWGADYVASAVSNGWGIDPKEITKEFSQFLNGKYTRERDGYTSKMYCLPPNGIIQIDTTLTLIIGFNGTLLVPQNRACELYVVNSDVFITSASPVTVHLYGSKMQTDTESNVTAKQH